MTKYDTITVVHSKNNARVKGVRHLHTKKGRAAQGNYIAQGFTVCTTLIESGQHPHAVFCLESSYPDVAHYCKPEQIICVSKEVMRSISTTVTPSPVLGVFRIPQWEKEHKIRPGLVLAGLSDPGNMGTIIRSAVAMNVPALYTINCTDVWAPKVVQASAGYCASIPIFSYQWNELVADVHAADIPLLATVVQHGNMAPTPAIQNALLVIGAEAHGIPEQWQHDCDDTVTLAMPGNTESLNAAVAASIVMYLGYVQPCAS